MESAADILDGVLDNAQRANGQAKKAGRPDAYDAATLYATDPDWRDLFDEALKAAKDEQRAEVQAKIDAALAAAEAGRAVLAALGGGPAAAPTVAKAAPKAKPVKALALLKDAGKEGVSARALTAELGRKASDVLDPLVEAGKAKKRGKRGGVRYFAV